MAKSKKIDLSQLKLLAFWILSIAAVIGALFILNGPVNYVDGDTVAKYEFEAITKGSEGISLGILGSIGSFKGTNLPIIAMIVVFVGVLMTIVGKAFLGGKTNIGVALGGVLILVGGVLLFFTAKAFVGANEDFDATKYVLSDWSVWGAIMATASGAGITAIEILL